jgi:hypothetical protein
MTVEQLVCRQDARDKIRRGADAPASRNREMAGDGATLAAVPAQALIRRGLRYLTDRWHEPDGPQARHGAGDRSGSE